MHGHGVLSRAAERCLEALRDATPFAEAIVQRQAEHLGYGLDAVPDEAYPTLAARVLMAAKVYLEPTAYARVERALRA